MDKTLDERLLEYVLAIEGDHWDDDSLHLSDLGGCPRRSMLRLTGAERRPVSPEKAREDELMFFVANLMHDVSYKSWDAAGIMIANEHSIKRILPDGWTGRFDAILDYNGRRIVDVKTLKYLAKSARLPYFKHTLQVVAYHIFAEEEYALTEMPILYYIQRDLGHPKAVECVVDVNERSKSFVKQGMKVLEEAKSSLPELPPLLDLEICFGGAKKRDKNKKEVFLTTNRDCEQCEYSQHSCEPYLSDELLASVVDKDSWEFTELGLEMRDEVQMFLMEELYEDS